MRAGGAGRSPWLRRGWLVALLLGLLLLLSLAGAAPGRPERPATATSEALSWQAPFNRPDHYPLGLRPDPSLYRPHALWMGRLILPDRAETARRPGDWTWLEVELAPPGLESLVGRTLRLRWQERPELQGLVRRVTTDIHLDAGARQVSAAGNVVPSRLDGRRAVGPLQSLAGARPHDDVTVRLEDVEVNDGPDPELRIGRPPVQLTGRWSALVRILGPAAPAGTNVGRGQGGDPELFRVRHYQRATGRFEGPIETVRLPRQPPDRYGRRLFDPRGVTTTVAGTDGWYLHGAPDAAGLFTVQALESRRLLRLSPDEVIEGTGTGMQFLLHRNWRDTPRQRGRVLRVSLRPDPGHDTGAVPWRIGERALLIHTFGGIGGRRGEPVQGFTVTGHFAFGQAEVIRDPFTGEPRWDLRYHQIYANNPNGIVAGTQDVSAWTGNLQRGWLGTRPISDVLVKGGWDPELLDRLGIQAEVLMARYRSGDGTGVATVTPATSCVQDSSQALWITLAGLPRQAELARSLDRLLTPFGMVRPDWRHNADRLASGVPSASAIGFQRGQSLLDVLLSWRSMLPRRAHDDLAGVFLRHGHPLWILRTDQVPGADPSLEPLAPTLLFGQIPLLATVQRRVADALFAPFGAGSLLVSLGLLGIFSAVVLPLGFHSGLLRWDGRGPAASSSGRAALRWIRAAPVLLVVPALGEELVFRVALLPHPLEGVAPAATFAWGMLGLGLYVLHHPLEARWWYRPARRLFDDPRFLVPCALLGATCTVAYQITGSLWSPTLIHWLVVLVWLEGLGGRRLLRPDPTGGHPSPATAAAPGRRTGAQREWSGRNQTKGLDTNQRS